MFECLSWFLLSTNFSASFQVDGGESDGATERGAGEIPKVTEILSFVGTFDSCPRVARGGASCSASRSNRKCVKTLSE